MVGALILELRIGPHTLQHEFQVALTANFPVILGWDFLSKHQVTIDLAVQHMSLFGHQVPLLSHADLIPLQCNCIFLTPVTVPPPIRDGCHCSCQSGGRNVVG